VYLHVGPLNTVLLPHDLVSNPSVTGVLNSEEWWLCIPVRKYLRKKQVKGRKFYLGLMFQSFYSRDFLDDPCAQYI
jgi:hypothetical protein